MPAGDGFHGLRALVLLILACAAPCAAGASLGLTVAVVQTGRPELPREEQVSEALRSCVSQRYGSLIELASAGGDGSVTVTLTRDRDRMVAVTELRPAAARPRTLTSTLPAAAAGSLVPTVAGDIAYLWFASTGFRGLTLDQPPPMVGRLSMDSLGLLTGWKPDELEPIALSSGGEGVVLCFPRRYLSLGPLFTVTTATMRDIVSQGAGPAAVLLSGVAAGPAGDIVLLSDKAGQILRVRRFLAPPRVIPAPGLSGPRAVLIRRRLATLDGGQIVLHPLSRGEEVVRLPAASFVSALSSDAEDNLWVFDAVERRVRVLSPAGPEVFSVRPLFAPSVMPLPQELAVYPDGSFLLGGSGEVWKFLATGVPLWRLRRMPGVPGEPLPSSFGLAADAKGGSFYLLDSPSRRVLQFAADSGTDPRAGRVARILAQASPRDRGALRSASDSLRSDGLTLMARDLLSGGAAGAGRDASDDPALLREKAERTADLADELSRDLALPGAASACSAASGFARALRSRDPSDNAAVALEERLAGRSADIEASLAEQRDVVVSLADPPLARASADGCVGPVVVRCTVASSAAGALGRVRLSVTLRGAALTPGLGGVDSLGPGEKRLVEIPVSPTGAADLEESFGDSGAAVLVTYEKGREARNAYFVLTAAGQAAGGTAASGRPGTPSAGGPEASEIACAAAAPDPVVQEFAAGSGGDQADPLLRLLSAVDTLGALGGRRGGPPADGLSFLASRRALRGLAWSDAEWAALVAAVAEAAGCPAGILAASGRVFPLVVTGITVKDALPLVAGMPALAAAAERLARDGVLAAPLAAGGGTAVGSFLLALASLSEKDVAGAKVVWLSSAAREARAEEPPASPFPVTLPAVRAAGTREALAGEVRAAVAALGAGQTAQ